MEKDSILAGLNPDQELNRQQRYWLKHYQSSQTSGNSMAEYAREHGLAIKSFYYWKKRLLQLGAIESNPKIQAKSPVFLPIKIKTDLRVDAACRVRFPNGMECEMDGMDESGLEQLLVAVSRLPQ